MSKPVIRMIATNMKTKARVPPSEEEKIASDFRVLGDVYSGYPIYSLIGIDNRGRIDRVFGHFYYKKQEKPLKYGWVGTMMDRRINDLDNPYSTVTDLYIDAVRTILKQRMLAG